MAKKGDIFFSALADKKIPLLTLDNKWHQLFTQAEMTIEIHMLENKLNELIKRQSKANTESKDIKKIKKKLMEEIVLIADELVKNPDSKKLSKDMDDHKRLVNECSEKLDAYEQELLELPREIDKTNRALMLASMEVCYKKIKNNTREIETISRWIEQARRELKKKMVRKQEAEAMNNELYSYMHDIFGADVIEIFDMKYNQSGTTENIKKSTKKEKEYDGAPES
ncbi:MAG: hypothetical protein IJO97_08090 [Lachnospiraceae bacterium]|nr:hypothetical protein [Lachnospiraceae bacterium]